MINTADIIKEYKVYRDGEFVGNVSNTAKQKTYLSRLSKLRGFNLVPVFN